MRKYAIPKIAYILLIMLISCLSFGYTYAYFSATATATADVSLGMIDIWWSDSFSGSTFGEMFADPTQIQVSGDSIMKRGSFVDMQAHTLFDDEGEASPILLSISNTEATVNAYCRIQIVATYTPKGGEEVVTCDDGWVQLGYYDELITTQGWFEHNGYYYYGAVDTRDGEGKITKATLTELEAGMAIPIANQLYLDTSADSSLLGGTMTITLILEGVQTTNLAYQSEWAVTW